MPNDLKAALLCAACSKSHYWWRTCGRPGGRGPLSHWSASGILVRHPAPNGPFSDILPLARDNPWFVVLQATLVIAMVCMTGPGFPSWMDARLFDWVAAP